LADFLALEAIRLYEPGLFRKIRESKERLLGSRQQGDAGHNNAKSFDPFLAEVPEGHRELARTALQRMFPRLEASCYGPEWGRQWDQERRICVEKHFDTYFRLSLGEDRISHIQIDELISRADDTTFIQQVFRQASSVQRRNGQSMVPVYLDEMTVHASRIPLAKVGTLLASLFEIHDEIDLDRDEDRGFMGVGCTTLRYHWLIRALTRDRTNLDDRSTIYLFALPTSSAGWYADFAISASDQYRPRENHSVAPNDFLVRQDAIETIRQGALAKVRAAAADGSLLKRRKLSYALYEWKDLAGGPAEVRAWTDGQLKNDTALVILAKTFTGQSWSAGMGVFGLGDRVATSKTHTTIDESSDILDFRVFKEGLEKLDHEATLPADTLRVIRTFLEAAPLRKGLRDADD
jgi:predicted KAP-like P-loop ATPase